MAGRYVEYRKYPLDLKYEFLKSGRLEGLEKFEIPRTTAAYWIAKRKSIIREALLDSEHLQRIADLEQEVLKERALRIMVEQVRKIFPYAFSERIVKSKDDRVHLVAAIQKAAALTSLKRCLEVLGLTPRVYYRWTTATKPCLITLAECGRRHPQQLTAKEVETMRVYLCSKEYAHIPVQSLCKLAQRKGDLFCSVDTWYKYKKMYDWQRPHRKWKAKRKERGVRATESNQIWHVDVTHIKLASGKTMYLQAVIDNFSRYIVAWKLSEKISSLKTVDLLKQARRNLQNRGDRIPCQIMTDGGPENRNKLVDRFMVRSKVEQIIARTDISSSNSMIEAFFRSLKSNYLKHVELTSRGALKKGLEFYINEHNNVIPHSALCGARPSELFHHIWCEEEAIKLRDRIITASSARRSAFLGVQCLICRD